MKEKVFAKERIYVCHTYYHVYVSFLKEMNLPEERRGQAAIVLSMMSTAFGDIFKRIEESGVFAQVILFDEKRDDFFPELAPYMNMKGNQLKIMLGRMKYTKLYGKLEEKYIPVDFREYRDIYVFCDSDPIGFYLNYKKIRYHAVEDGLNTLKHFDAARHFNRRFFRLKAFLSSVNLLFIQNGYGKYCIDMEVNDISCLKHKLKKYVEVPREKLVHNLKDSQIEVLLKVFIENIEELEKLAGCEDTVLVLTEPLCDLETREKIFKDIVSAYGRDGKVVIKPHPRDVLDYRKIFPEYVVIDGKVPMEMFGYIPDLMFDRVVGVFTEMAGIKFARECVRLGSDFMDRYEDPSVHRYSDN